MSLDTRIAIGTQFLDSVRPGWAGQIDPIDLDLEDPNMCVLGQLFEEEGAENFTDGFTAGGWVLHDWLEGEGYDVSEDYVSVAELAGFEIEGAMTGWPTTETYAELQAKWLAVIDR